LYSRDEKRWHEWNLGMGINPWNSKIRKVAKKII